MYGKINEDTNFLMTNQILFDNTWLPLADFVKNGDVYWTYYIDPQTPDMVKEDALVANIDNNTHEAAVAAITVHYIPINELDASWFSGSEESQAKMTTSMQVLEGKGDTKTRNFKDTSSVMHKLTRDDFDNLLDLIEPIYESITDD